MYKKILVATDGSDSALDAARRASEMQKKCGAQVVLFHAEKHYYAPTVNNQSRAFPFFDMDILKPDPIAQTKEINKAFKVWGMRMLEKTKEIFDKEGLEAKVRLIENMGPVDYAKEISKNEDFDLIVVGCKGHHSKLHEIFIGSVAKKIANEAECDVLIVR